jgi:FixJ family two-component response regulator
MTVDRSLVAVVDDEESVGRAIERLLRSAGYATQGFSSGESFLSWLADHNPGCVVLDIYMPGLTGLDVQERMNKLSIDLPVVAVTGHDTGAVKERLLAGGARAFFHKPVDSDELLGAVASAIKSRPD